MQQEEREHIFVSNFAVARDSDGMSERERKLVNGEEGEKSKGMAGELAHSDDF